MPADDSQALFDILVNALTGEAVLAMYYFRRRGTWKIERRRGEIIRLAYIGRLGEGP